MAAILNKELAAALHATGDRQLELVDPETKRTYVLVDSETHRQAILQRATEQWNALDVLVNNAGAGAIGRFDVATSVRLRRVMEIDFFACR